MVVVVVVVGGCRSRVLTRRDGGGGDGGGDGHVWTSRCRSGGRSGDGHSGRDGGCGCLKTNKN